MTAICPFHGPCREIAQGNRLDDLMQQIADEAAIKTSDSPFKAVIRDDGQSWFEVGEEIPGSKRHRALEYLHLRGLIEYSEDGKLVRFVEDRK